MTYMIIIANRADVSFHFFTFLLHTNSLFICIFFSKSYFRFPRIFPDMRIFMINAYFRSIEIYIQLLC